MFEKCVTIDDKKNNLLLLEIESIRNLKKIIIENKN